MAKTMSHIMRTISENSDIDRIRVSDLLTISSHDRSQILAWNSQDLIPIQDDWIAHHLFSETARKYPDAQAIDSWDGSMSYADLLAESTTLAQILRQRGVTTGSWVVLCFEKSRFAVVSMLAILIAGGACVPLDQRNPVGRLSQIIQKTGAKHALAGNGDIAARLQEAAATLSDDVNGGDGRPWDVMVVPDLTTTARENQNDPEMQSGNNNQFKLTATHPALCLFTSGSTGTPKGIIIPHGHVCSAAKSYRDNFDIDKTSRILQFASYSFDIASADTFLALLHGATLCIPSETNRIDGLQDYILATRPNWANLTPTVARQLEPKVVCHTLKTLVLSGEAVRDADVEDWVDDAGVNFFNAYGPAENTFITTATPGRKTHGSQGSSIGYGVNTRTWVVHTDDDDDGNSEKLVMSLAPIGAAGELFIESTHLALGYLDQPAKTAASFLNDIPCITNISTPLPKRIKAAGKRTRRFYRTGDLVRYCEDESLIYIGRADGQVKVGGQRIELSDIEHHIRTSRGENKATNTGAVVLLPKDGPLGSRLTAVVTGSVTSPETTHNEHSSPKSSSLALCDTEMKESMLRGLSQVLPRYMIPSVWLRVDRFPVSATGKIDKKGLTSMIESLTMAEHDYLTSTVDEIEDAEGSAADDSFTANQKDLRNMCSQVLNISPGSVAMSKSFIALGGDSITAMQVSSASKRIYKKTITVKELLSQSPLMDVAHRLKPLTTSLTSTSSSSVAYGKRYLLTPIQRLFFETATTPAAWNHYHQSIVMKLAEPRKPEVIEKVISGVIRRHPMLRARFHRDKDERGEIRWMQYILAEADDVGTFRLEVIEEAHLDKDKSDIMEKREAAMASARRNIDIISGPLIRAQLFTNGEDADVLFVVVHHLVVDLVSWRSILEEMDAALRSDEGLTESEAATFEESTPFLAWADLLRSSHKINHHETLPYFLSSPPPAPDHDYWGVAPADNVYGNVKEARIVIDQHIGGQVLSSSCHQALDADPVDILIAAILLSFKRTFPDRSTPAVFTEGHGREPWDPDLDIARTVGWFTTMVPVYAGQIGSTEDEVIGIVKRVKDYRRGTSNNGFDYFSALYHGQDGSDDSNLLLNHVPPEIMFNFEGKYQAIEKQAAILKPESWHAGEALGDQGLELQRFCLFELAAAVLDSKLHFTFAWNSQSRHQERISMWLMSLLPACLAEISSVLVHVASRQWTLSDVTSLKLQTYSELDAVMSTVRSLPGVNTLDDVEGVYPGSPMQTSLGLSQSRDENGAYEVEMTWEVIELNNSNSETSSTVDVRLLSGAWEATVARHAMLRTVILEAITNTDISMINQAIIKTIKPDIVNLEARSVSEAMQILETYPLYRIGDIFASERPPHRLLICKVSKGSCSADQVGKVFVRLQINHIVFDGMSTNALLRSFAQSYKELAQTAANSSNLTHRTKHTINQLGNSGRESLQVQHDFLEYILDSTRRQQSLEYWKQYLTGSEPCFFPTLIDTKAVVHKGQSSSSPAGRSDGSLLSHGEMDTQRQQRGHTMIPLDATGSDIQAALQKLQVTISSLFQTVWALVLRSYTGGCQSVFGYLASGRDAPVNGIEDAIGPFISMLVCRVDFTGGQRGKETLIKDVMASVQDASANSLSNQGVSLAEIQNALKLPGSTQLFNSGLTFSTRMTPTMQAQEGWELLFEQVSLHDPTEYDISLIVETGSHGDNEISLYLDHLSSSISEDHAMNIASTVNHIVNQIIRDPLQARVGDTTSRISDSDWMKLKSWNKNLISPVEECLHSIFSKRAQEHPEREVIYSWDGSMTYRELDDLSSLLANHLVTHHGVKVEQLIPVCFEKSKWAIVTMLALIKAGAAFVLLDPAQPEARLWTIIDLVEASLIICSLRASKESGIKAKAEARNAKTEHKLALVHVHDDFVNELQSTSSSHNQALEAVAVTPENTMYIVFTSGTTGTPKGAVATHRALATGLYEMADNCGMVAQGSNLRSLQFASYTFDASIGDIFATLQAGGCLCVPRDEDRTPADVSAFISKSKVNYVGVTPSFASLLNPATIPTVKALCVAGEPLTTSLIETWNDKVKISNTYGPTEATVACIANTKISGITPAASIGRGYRTATWIVDPDNHDILMPIGAVGELLVEGPILCRGYLNQPEKTAMVFIDGPLWLHESQLRDGKSRLYKTGDLVRYAADGSLLFVGRKDTQIKINGQRVEIGEIEHALRSSLRTASSSEGTAKTEEEQDCSIVVDLLKRGADYPGEADLLTAFICVGTNVPENNNSELMMTQDAEAMSKLDMLVQRFQHPHSKVSNLPQYMAPQAYVPISRLPLAPSGKVDRRALQQMCAKMSRDELLNAADGRSSHFGGEKKSVKTTEASTKTLANRSEKQLAQIWEKVLQVKGGVMGSSNFFRLGGNSMSALGLRSEARRCGLSLSVADVFAHPVLSDMAAVLTRLQDSTTATNSVVPSPLASSQSGDDTEASSLPEEDTSSDDFAEDLDKPFGKTSQNSHYVEPFSLLQMDLDGDGSSTTISEEVSDAARSCNVSPEEIQDIYPSTPMQEALMVLASNSESRGAYGMHAPFKLSPSEVDMDRFRSTWEEVTSAHDIYRSRVVSRRGKTYVVVMKSAIPMRYVSVASLDQYLLEEEGDHFAYGSPLCRLSIARDEQNDSSYFVFAAHHAIYDGWSIRLTFNDFLQRYRQSSHAPSIQATSNLLSFKGFAKELCLMDTQEAQAYWRKALTPGDDEEESFEFPIYPPSHKPVVRANLRFDDLPFDASAARNAGVTITTMFHSAWALTLAQYTASKSVTFGVTLQGRDFPMDDIENVVGPVIVTVPRQLQVRPEQNVAEFLQEVHNVTVSSLRYQHLGLHQIQTLGPDARRACDFSSLLVVNNNPLGDDDFAASLRAEGIEPVDIQAPDFHPYPLVVECFASSAETSFKVGYDPECIDEAMVKRVVAQFQHNLESLCRASSVSSSTDTSTSSNGPQTDVASLLVGVAASHVDELMKWNSEAAKSFDDLSTVTTTVPDLLRRHAEQYPSDMAIDAHDTESFGGITFASFERYSTSLACHLKGLLDGYEKNGEEMETTEKQTPFVALCMDNTAAAMICMMATNKAGAAFMCLDLSQPEARLQSLTERAGAKLALISPCYQGMFKDAPFSTESIDMTTIIEVNKSCSAAGVTETVSAQLPAIKQSDTAYLIYTSGSTGTPKGVVMSHGAWGCQMQKLVEFFKFNRTTRMLQFAKYNFDACLLDIFVAQLSGACLCVPSYEDKMNNLEGYLIDKNVNSIALTPTVARILQPSNLPLVRSVTLFGEAMTQSDFQSWISKPADREHATYRHVINSYGPSEACLAVNGRHVTPPASEREASVDAVAKLKTWNNIGNQIGAMEWIMNPRRKTALVPIGAVGELLVSGPSLAQGYNNDADKTQASFRVQAAEGLDAKDSPRRMYCTGDLVRFVSDGSLEYMGRRDTQIKLRGQRIDLGEIEHHVYQFLLNSCPEMLKSVRLQLYKPDKVRDSGENVASDGSQLPSLEPFLGAMLVLGGVTFDREVQGVPCRFLTASEGHGASDDDVEVKSLQNMVKELRRSLRTILPEYMVPTAIVIVERLPQALTGKGDGKFIQSCLRESMQETTKAAKRGGPTTEGGQTTTPEEALMQKWWASIVGIDAAMIGPASDFFTVGGNSVSAMRLVGLARTFNYVLRHEDVFTCPILSDMALRLVVMDTSRTTENGSDQAISKEQPFDLIRWDEIESLFEDVGSAASSSALGISRQDVADVFPCTSLQEQLMAATCRYPGAYTVVERMDIPETRLATLKKAWNSIIRAYEILRTHIILSPGHGALQVVLKDSIEPQWSEVLDADQFIENVQKTTGYGRSLVHLAVVKDGGSNGEGEEEPMRRVLFSAHHAMYDAVFLANMWERLDEAMRGASRVRAQKTVTPFKTFIKHIADQDASEAKDFWRQKLLGISTTQFPPRPNKVVEASSSTAAKQKEHEPMATERLSRPLLSLDNDDQSSTNKDEQRSRAEKIIRPRTGGTTAATVAHAAWALTISHYTANPDTVFGATLSGREAAPAEVEDPNTIAGPTITTVPYRVVVDNNSTVSQFLVGMQKDVVQAVRFGQLGLGGIGRISDDCRQACQFDSLFQVMQASGSSGQDNDNKERGSEVDRLEHHTVDTGVYFPSAVVAEVELPDGTTNTGDQDIILHLIYDPVLLRGNLGQSILDTFATLFKNLLQAAPDTPLGNIRAISA